MEIGRKIYFSKSTGAILWDKGEMQGAVVETTQAQDEATMPILSVFDAKGDLGVLQLDYGQDDDKFAACAGYYIDPTTSKIVYLTGPVQFSAAAGTYPAAQTVELSSWTSDAVIYYTTDGSDPTTASTKYTGAITVSATQTITAIAVSALLGTTAAATEADYTISAA